MSVGLYWKILEGNIRVTTGEYHKVYFRKTSAPFFSFTAKAALNCFDTRWQLTKIVQ